MEGKKNATMKAKMATANKTDVGIGVSSSAISGANTVKNLEMKLQIPVAVALFANGNTL